MEGLLYLHYIPENTVSHITIVFSFDWILCMCYLVNTIYWTKDTVYDNIFYNIHKVVIISDILIHMHLIYSTISLAYIYILHK